MTSHRLAAVDAQFYWMSTKTPNDQFLVYGFDGAPTDLAEAMALARRRANSCSALRQCIDDSRRLAFPAWVNREPAAGQFVIHRLDDPTWAGCLNAVGRLADAQLDARVWTWRLHVFASVDGVPGACGPATVVAFQVAHALADGVRASALAAVLLGRRRVQVPDAPPIRFTEWTLPWRSVQAVRGYRQLVRDTRAEHVPAQCQSIPALRTNSRPSGARQVRTLTRNRTQLHGPSVTSAVLAAVSTALCGHLRELGDGPVELAAEVPMVKASARQANNHFGNVGVGLHPELRIDERLGRIHAELGRRRQRAGHPAMLAADRAFAATPALLIKWGVRLFDPTLSPTTVTGNTVVSSVNRGAADLSFAGAPVVVTAGYPALSPAMGLTHGVHGIGDTVAISVHAAESAIGDIDAYLDRLDSALP